MKTSNVSALIEMADLREAQRAYEANLNVIEASRGDDARRRLAAQSVRPIDVRSRSFSSQGVWRRRSGARQGSLGGKESGGAQGPGFGDILNTAVGSLSKAGNAAETAVTNAAMGKRRPRRRGDGRRRRRSHDGNRDRGARRGDQGLPGNHAHADLTPSARWRGNVSGSRATSASRAHCADG